MKLRFRSFCSGIESASVAWNALGWSALSFCEVEPFCCALLEARHGGVVNLGDLLTIKPEEIADAPGDVWVAGTPCQSFSVAGLRGGVDDARGNLALRFFQLARVGRPRWLVWENVPGVLSSGAGRDFGSILGALAECGYGFAYRILDAQYFGLAQRRKRVFVVGYLGDWRRAAAVLFERHCLSWNPPPSREAGEGVAPSLASRPTAGGGLGTDFDCDGGLIEMPLARCDTTREGQRMDPEYETLVCGTLNANGKAAGSATQQDAESGMLIAHALSAEGHDASEDGTGRGMPLVPVTIGFHANARADEMRFLEDQSGPITRGQVPGVLSFQTRIARNGRGQPKDITDALTGSDGGTHADSKPHVAYAGGVRRIMPIEAERLQGFPDGYTLIDYRGKPAKDAPRYRALGNSKAVPVVRWIGQRIEAVEALP